LKQRVKKLEKKKKSSLPGLKRLYKVGSLRRLESSEESLGALEDASKQGRKIVDLDADAKVTLIDETHERNDEEMLFDVNDDLQGKEVIVEKEVAKKEVSTADPVTTAGEVVTTVSTAATITLEEVTLAQPLVQIKTSKPKAKGIVFKEPNESKTAPTPIVTPQQLPQAKEKGKAKMIEPEKTLKKMVQILFDEEVTRKLEAQLQAELEEEERVARQREEEANITLIESWDNAQAIMEADYELAARLQSEEQGKLTIEEKSKLFVELMEKRKKHFAKLRTQEKKVVEGNDDKVDDDQEEEKMKKHMEIVLDEEELVFDVVPLAIKTPIVNYKIIKEGKIGYYQLIKADGSSKRYSLMIHMLQDFDKEDLETLWKLVKAKHGNIRLEERYE
ncbi:hypothetical protein Tco_0833850, partial [Tanacetum coccineum]